MSARLPVRCLGASPALMALARIARESARKLAAPGGSEPRLRTIARRRPGAANGQVILVDTSIWVNHLRRHDAALATHLEAGDVLCHSYVIGEIGLGLLKQPRQVLVLLAALPSALVVSHDEAMAFVEQRRLAGLASDGSMSIWPRAPSSVAPGSGGRLATGRGSAVLRLEP